MLNLERSLLLNSKLIYFKINIMATFKKHLTVFESASDYEAFKSSEEFVTPNVSLCRDTNKVKFEPIEYIDEYTIVDGQFDSYNKKNDFMVGKFSYSRTFINSNVWNALYLPVEVPMSLLIDKYDVCYITNVNNNDINNDGEIQIDEESVEIKNITDNNIKLCANYPYLIKAKTDLAKNFNIILYNVKVHKSEENSIVCSSVFKRYIFKGNTRIYTKDELTNKFGINIEGLWSYCSGSMKPFRIMLSQESIPEYITPSVDVDNLEYVEEYTIIDGQMEEFVNDTPKKIGLLTYKRNLYDDFLWNPLFIPFDVPLSIFSDLDMEVVRFNNVTIKNNNDGVIDKKYITHLVITNGILYANYPYMFRRKSDKSPLNINITLSNIILHPSNKENLPSVNFSTIHQNYTIKGTYKMLTPIDLGDRLIVNENGDWTSIDKSYNLSPFRLYLEIKDKK